RDRRISPDSGSLFQTFLSSWLTATDELRIRFERRLDIPEHSISSLQHQPGVLIRKALLVALNIPG
ncbi:hypothetical protein, partial [Pseudomonas luteola]|uniref:hypothetical protein n=1 Tax=Pseudomonas luteola TaxID=47886 RepID=UPI00289AAE26